MGADARPGIVVSIASSGDEKHAISQELASKLLTWKHPGFSARVGEPIPADDTQALENLAGYVVRKPLSLQTLVYRDGQQAVIYKGLKYKGLKHNPTLGLETMDPLEWQARMADHIPDPGKQRTLFYAHYSNRVRGDRACEEPGEAKVEAEPAKKRRCSASWACLIAKVFHADPQREKSASATATQAWEDDASRAPSPFRHTTEGDVEDLEHPHHL